MQGRVKFFRKENCWGVITDPETNQEYHVHINDVVERRYLERNQWVSFDLSDRDSRRSAINVVPIDCPPDYLLKGTVTKYFPDLGYGFVEYKHDGRTQSIFFHCNDLLRIDGVEQVPCVGCEVSFCLGQKFDRKIAAQIWIERRPDFEEQFAAAEELPLDVREPVSTPQLSVLSAGNRKKTLLEIVRQRKEGKLK